MAQKLAKLAALLVGFIAAPCSGAIITFDFSGTVQFNSPALASQFPVGQPITGSFNYNTTAVDTVPSPNEARYPLTSNISVTFGSTYTATGTLGETNVGNDISGSDSFQVLAANSPGRGAVVAPPIGVLVAGALLVSLLDSDGTVFSSDAIPTSLSLAPFEFKSVDLIFDDSDPRTLEESVRATITSLTQQVPAQVPEPFSLALVGTAFAALAVARRRSARPGVALPPEDPVSCPS